MQPLLIQTVFRFYAVRRIITQKFRQWTIKQKKHIFDTEHLAKLFENEWTHYHFEFSLGSIND